VVCKAFQLKNWLDSSHDASTRISDGSRSPKGTRDFCITSEIEYL